MRQATLFDFNKKIKFLVIASCSKKKLDHSATAANLYQSSLFKKTKAFAEKLAADFMILSAKYGLIKSNEEIDPYDEILYYQADINRLKETELPKLEQLQQQYHKIIIIMGKKYRKVFETLLDSDNFLTIKSKKGIGTLLQNLEILNNYSNDKLKQVILSETGEYEREITVSRGEK